MRHSRSKVRYKQTLLTKILSVVETEEMYLNAQRRAATVRNGSRGIEYGMKPTIKDAMGMVKDAWSSVTSETIMRCWRKANCLPIIWQQQMNNDSDHAERNYTALQVPHEEILGLCDLLSGIRLKTSSFYQVPELIYDSLVDPNTKPIEEVELKDGLNYWCRVEDEPIAMDVIIEEYINRSQEGKDSPADIEDEDSEIEESVDYSSAEVLRAFKVLDVYAAKTEDEDAA